MRHATCTQDPMHVTASQGTLASEGYCVCNRLIKNGHMTWATFTEVRKLLGCRIVPPRPSDRAHGARAARR